MPKITFPRSSSPNLLTGESGGRLINAFADALTSGSPNTITIRRDFGMKRRFQIGGLDGEKPRGMIFVDPILYIAYGENVYSVTESNGQYSVTQLSGTIAGNGDIMFAHNNRVPTKQTIALHENGLSLIDSSSVASFTDPDLPASNSVCFMDGYFIYTTRDGRAFASDINDTNINANNFITAEAQPDGLYRAISFRGDLLLMGDNSIEFYSNTGNPIGFPFTRGHRISIGLAGTYAVSGFEEGFGGVPMWVGSDNRVYIYGYEPQAVSNSSLDYLISQIEDKSELKASVYNVAGHACWVLRSNSWTWVYNQKTQQWHERKSYLRNDWRGRYGAKAFGEWLVLDDETDGAFTLSQNTHKEHNKPLVFEAISERAIEYPGNFQVSHAHFNFVVGVGNDRGAAPVETEPHAMISWSDDGGSKFATDLRRPLGTQGDRRQTVSVHRLGRIRSQGRLWRLRVSDPVTVSLMGGAFEGKALRSHV